MVGAVVLVEADAVTIGVVGADGDIVVLNGAIIIRNAVVAGDSLRRGAPTCLLGGVGFGAWDAK